MDEQIALYPCTGKLHSNKNTPSTDTHNKTDGSQNNYADGKETEQSRYYEIPFIEKYKL